MKRLLFFMIFMAGASCVQAADTKYTKLAEPSVEHGQHIIDRWRVQNEMIGEPEPDTRQSCPTQCHQECRRSPGLACCLISGSLAFTGFMAWFFAVNS